MRHFWRIFLFGMPFALLFFVEPNDKARTESEND